jgi:ABC-type multidrug transport system permease subunit
MHRIKSFSVFRTSATMGILMFLFVLACFLLVASFALIGLLVSLISHSAIHHTAVNPAMPHELRWVFAAMPLIEGMGVFLFTALFCWLYNRIAPFTGGIELKVVGLPEALPQTQLKVDS